jgi:hypothetical protein
VSCVRRCYLFFSVLPAKVRRHIETTHPEYTAKDKFSSGSLKY